MTWRLQIRRQIRLLYRVGSKAVFFYLLAAGLGVWWYYSASERANSFNIMDLGVFQLFQMVFVVFLAICLGKGFTVFRILLLVIPYAICSFLTVKLITLRPALDSATDFSPLRSLVFVALLCLGTVLAWVAIFPFPFTWRSLPSDRGVFWRRLEWTVAALLAASLVPLAWYTISLGEIVQHSSKELIAHAQQYAGRDIQSHALSIYVFLFLKVALRFEIARKYATDIR